MGLFDKKDHIKSTKDLDRALKKNKFLTKNERKEVEKKAEKFIRESSGLSKKEWDNKVLRPLMKDSKDNIDRGEISKLKKREG